MKKSMVIFGAAALVLGNLIGAGILALPISMGLSGALPSFILIVIYSGMMLFTAEVLAGECMDDRQESLDYPTLYGRYLGRGGKWVAAIANAIILYGALIAYLSGGSQILADLFGVADSKIAVMAITLAFSALLIFMTSMDLSVINKYNSVLVTVMVLAFFGLIAISCGHMDVARFKECHWQYAGIAIPLIVTAAHFHNIIPILAKDMDWDFSAIRKAMLLGMGVALVMNLSWVLCGIACLPRHGANGLVQAFVQSVPATVPMHNVIGSGLFTILGVFFSILAIITSFLANGLGLKSFVTDILVNSFNNRSQILKNVLTFAPPVIIAILWPHIFLKALNVMGGIGIVMLFGILPCLLVILKRKYSFKFKLAGATFLLLSLFAFFLVVGGLCGSSFCSPNPALECQKHEEEIECKIPGHEECKSLPGAPAHTHNLRIRRPKAANEKRP